MKAVEYITKSLCAKDRSTAGREFRLSAWPDSFWELFRISKPAHACEVASVCFHILCGQGNAIGVCLLVLSFWNPRNHRSHSGALAPKSKHTADPVCESFVFTFVNRHSNKCLHCNLEMLRNDPVQMFLMETKILFTNSACQSKGQAGSWIYCICPVSVGVY